MGSQSEFTAISQYKGPAALGKGCRFSSCFFSIRRRTAFFQADTVRTKKSAGKMILRQCLKEFTADDRCRFSPDMTGQHADRYAIPGQFLCQRQAVADPVRKSAICSTVDPASR